MHTTFNTQLNMNSNTRFVSNTHRKRTTVSLPDSTRRHASTERLAQSRGKLHQDQQHLASDKISVHSEAMGGRGLKNGDVRKRDTGEGEIGRIRVLTAKGAEDQRKTHHDNRVRAMRRLNRTMRSIDILLKDNSNVEQVKGEMLEVDHIFSEVMESHGKYHALIDDYEERQESSKWMNDNDATVFGFNRFVNKWITDSNVQHDTVEVNHNYQTSRKKSSKPSSQNHRNDNIMSQTINKEHSRLLPDIPFGNAPDITNKDSHDPHNQTRPLLLSEHQSEHVS